MAKSDRDHLLEQAHDDSPSQDSLTIIEATRAACDDYGHGYGSTVVALGPEHIEALRAGKMLAWYDDEYVTFVLLDAQNA